MKNPLVNSDKSQSPKDVNSSSPIQEAGASLGPMLCGDIAMRIDRNGLWSSHGSPIGRQELVKLFASVLKRDETGDFWLITPVEKARIQVEDAPFLAVELIVDGEGKNQKLTIRTNIDDIVTIDDDHPLEVEFDPETAEPAPYITIREGIRARLARPVYYELVEIGEEAPHSGDVYYGIWSCNSFFPLGKLQNDDECDST
jgi:hypothetical protein